MISKTMMIGVSLVVLATLSLALPRDRTNSERQGKNSCSSKCKNYFECNSNETLPSGEDYGENVIDLRIDAPDSQIIGKCKHYLKKCCPKLIPKPQPAVSLSTTKCGYSNRKGVGFKTKGALKNESNYGEFPWQVAVLRRDHVVGEDGQLMECGGSIIKRNVILTATHCVRSLDKENIIVRAGEWDAQTSGEQYPVQERNVKEVILHEDYYGGGGYNNVALLILDYPLDYNEVIGEVCLPRQNEPFDNLNCIVTGWGKDVFGKMGRYQAIMKKIELPMVPRDTCQKTMRKVLRPNYKLHESILCAGGNAGEDTCEGDGGSPLVCARKGNPEQFIQAGIVSWGVDCGQGTPAFYTNVPLFRDWIDGHLEKL